MTEMVVAVNEKSGTSKAGKAYTKFDIAFESGITASTFKAEDAEEADKAVAAGLPVEFRIEQNGKFWNLKSIRMVDAAGPDNPRNYPSEAEMAEVSLAQDDLNY